ncbi:protein involved in tellurite resistance [Paraoerskovia sediminicola]|uniref:Protein involved in tellurite resistance n=1 Tax=Paraoerskovia sediminicola TaxID=1138587 RepID=A0ABN6XBF8_9CELL|nr:toxic anion resistance protein [Paraoerskovia sediminicola]BDZ42307.1 protein involved in tellurite resistance [Paraoerskovia sediminicola]
MSTPSAAAQPAPAAPLVLEAPAAAPLVSREQAAATIAAQQQGEAAAAAQTAAEAKAQQFVAQLAGIDAQSPEFSEKVKEIASLGDEEIRASAAVSNRMLERPASQSRETSAQGKVSDTLIELRQTVTELDPNRADLTGVKKLLKFLPGGNAIDRYFAKYQSAQSQLDAIIRALESGQGELLKDNAAIELERNRMWDAMNKLGELKVEVEALDVAISARIAEAEAAGDTETAQALKSDVLFAVRQRHQDLMTQMAVSVQGYLAMDLIRKNNLELVRGVERAQTTTVSALRTAVIVAQALGQQKLVLDQVTALNTTTSNLIESTSQQLKQQGAAIQEQAASSTIEVAKLQAAFQNVYETMDAIDTFKAQANDSMAVTIGELEQQVAQAKPYVERAQRSIDS